VLLLSEPLFLPCPFPLPLPPLLGVGAGGEGPSKDMMVLAAVGVEAATTTEDALLLRVPSRMWRPVPGPPSCPARSP
jgi:hypothetical protein